MDPRTVIVTGSTSGIGEATAAEFLKNGDNVVIFSPHQGDVDGATERLSGLEGELLSLVGDVRDIRDIKHIVKSTMQKFGRIDVLINNAGIAIWKPIEEHTDKDFDLMMDVNIKGPWMFIREVVPIMKDQGYGIVIQISSIRGEIGSKNYSVYSPSKFALIGLTQSLADEIQEGIRFYSVLPAGTHTPLHMSVHPWKDPDKLMTPEYLGGKIFKLSRGKKPSGFALRVYK
ncbi:SDR family oxidoreductase [Candidatus Uhrbacteria bacterium]|jgi:NAD(P)-dependent dehydrogenase (short-subunit alcohol dehydrogenase family)|nr:SDR family oxidoreductase [Candidatus Uhrbacteria bacterium]